MFDDATSVVRVTQYFKTLTVRDDLTGLPVTYRVPLDWGIGEVDYGRDGAYLYGSPYQLFSAGIYGDPVQDSRVLVVPEELPLSQLTGADRALTAGTLHFKHPNI